MSLCRSFATPYPFVLTNKFKPNAYLIHVSVFVTFTYVLITD